MKSALVIARFINALSLPLRRDFVALGIEGVFANPKYELRVQAERRNLQGRLLARRG